MDRREFVSFLVGGGFALALAPRALAATRPISPWIAIAPDGRVTLTTTALEMGQGSRTGQAQVLACEMDAAWESVSTVFAPETDPFLVDGELFSGGSDTLKSRFDVLRRAGATVRAQLKIAAANRWRVDPATVITDQGRVMHRASGRSLSYGQLAAEAAAIPTPKDPPLKAVPERTYVGKSLSTLDQLDKVTGAAHYGIDLRLPGMLFATLRQAPTTGGTLASVDEAPALKVRGVKRVVVLKDAVAVVADTTWAAFKGAKALDPKWAPATGLDTAGIHAALAASLDSKDAIVSPRSGGEAIRTGLRAAYAAAERKHEATYEIAYLAHATLEPMNATARADATHAEVWAPAQSPNWLRNDTAAMSGLTKENITVHTLLMGGGFGRRGRCDFGGRAVQVAQAVGAPVQVVWTREEDMTHDFYRPAMRMQLRAPLGADGLIASYEVIAATTDDLTGGSGPRPYNRLSPSAATLTNVKAGVRIGAWRAVDPGMAMFARESFIDECAHVAGADPLAYRDALLGDNARARRVLQAAAQAIGWNSPRAPGVGRGLALLDSWDTLVAHVIEVKVEGQKLRVSRVVVALDCGTAVNPQQVRAQCEGGALMGLSAALGEEITVTGGRTDQANFDTYPVLRMNHAPAVQAIILDTPGAPVGGVGEPPVPGVAPALANAIFAATGRRIRELPIRKAGFEI